MKSSTFNKLKEYLNEAERDKKGEELFYSWHILDANYNSYTDSWTVIFNIMVSPLCHTSSEDAFNEELRPILDGLSIQYHPWSKKSYNHIVAE